MPLRITRRYMPTTRYSHSICSVLGEQTLSVWPAAPNLGEQTPGGRRPVARWPDTGRVDGDYYPRLSGPSGQAPGSRDSGSRNPRRSGYASICAVLVVVLEQFYDSLHTADAACHVSRDVRFLTAK
jgi:hypothetical protein